MSHTRQEKLEAFGRLLDMMDILREQCPWDKKQTMDSLRILTIEEVYELVEALVEKDMPNIEEELGDVMLHLLFYSKIGEEQGAFDIASVLDKEYDKLEVRHPHIFGDVVVSGEDDVKRNWEQIKLKSKKNKKQGVLSGVPSGLPALVKSYRMQEKAAAVGFEWEHKQDVWKKVQEEIAEFHEEVTQKNPSQERKESEYGDLLFTLVNYARFEGIDPEAALERCNIKFKNRVTFIEENAPTSLSEMSLEEMDSLWNKAKENGIH